MEDEENDDEYIGSSAIFIVYKAFNLLVYNSLLLRKNWNVRLCKIYILKLYIVFFLKKKMLQNVPLDSPVLLVFSVATNLTDKNLRVEEGMEISIRSLSVHSTN